MVVAKKIICSSRNVPAGGVFVLLSFLFACDCGANTRGLKRDALCDVADPPPACGTTCNTNSDCEAGFYCSAGRCSADCLPGDSSCGAGYRCDNDGMCVDSSHDGNICAVVNLQTTRSTPNIMLLVDRSGSMKSDFGSQTRWQAIATSVFADGGPIENLEGSARFGLTFYSNKDGDVACGDTGCDENTCLGNKNDCSSSLDCLRCPTPSCLVAGTESTSDIIEQAPALNQFSVLQQMFSDYGPNSGTPTGDAISFVTPELAALASSTGEPTLLVVATDGSPDRCESTENSDNHGLDTVFDGENVTDGMEESLLAAHTAQTQGIDSYIISVGSGTVALSHLQQMANVGLGLDQYEPAATQAAYYEADDTQGLVDAINAIIGGAVTCNLTLSQPIVAASACNGTVRYEGKELACRPNDGNGWFPGAPDADGNTSVIQLRGTACDVLKRDGGQVSGAFPCYAIPVVD